MAILMTGDSGEIALSATVTRTITMSGSGNVYLITAKMWRTTVHTLKTCVVHNMLSNVNCGFVSLLNTRYSSSGVITFKTPNDGAQGGYNNDSGNKIIIDFINNHNEWQYWYWQITPLHFT